MNEYDSDRILDLSKTIGYVLTKNISEADCYILNTCHIREKATDKVYHDVGRVKKEFRNRKKPILLVAGCVAQAEGDEILKRESYIDGIIGPQSYHEIPTIINKIESSKKKVNHTNFDVVEKFDKLNIIKNTNSKISSFLTIQEGCDKFCHFCVVPYTRGPEHSRSLKEILSEAKQLIDNGTKEITLLGQNVNAYNFLCKENKRKYDLSDLILKLEKIEDLKRIRFTTSHPKDMDEKLINCFGKSKKLMPFLHLPIQSGSDKILKKMNRKHNIDFYENVLKKLKNINQDIEFSSDFLIGYPGETDEDFNKTFELINKFNFINSYSFIYSPRPGTPASNLNQIDYKVAHNRLKKIQELLFKIQIKRNKNLVGLEFDVLVENKMKNSQKFFGRIPKMTSVIFDSLSSNIGEIVKVKIIDANQNNLFGEHVGFKRKLNS